MSDENRPSIAELQRLCQDNSDNHDATLALAAPVLLEIAAAALLERGSCDHPEGRCGNGHHFRGCSRFDGDQRLRTALAKVRP